MRRPFLTREKITYKLCVCMPKVLTCSKNMCVFFQCLQILYIFALRRYFRGDKSIASRDESIKMYGEFRTSVANLKGFMFFVWESLIYQKSQIFLLNVHCIACLFSQSE